MELFVRRRLAEMWPVPGGPSDAAVRDMLDRRTLPDGQPDDGEAPTTQ